MKKNIFALILLLCLAGNAFSQEKNKIREIGLHFTHLDSFGLRYKTGNENILFRITALSLMGGSITNELDDMISLKMAFAGFGLNLGFEKPVIIDDRFHFYYGGELLGNLISQKSEISGEIEEEEKIKNYQAGLGCILGFSYNLSERIKLSVEVVPSFSYQRTQHEEGHMSGYRFSLNNHNAGITIGYRF